MPRLGSRYLVQALLAVGLVVGGRVSLPAGAAATHPLAACAPLAAHLHSGPLPYHSVPLYTDRTNRWHPIATDGRHVLIGWEYSRETQSGGPVHLSTVTLPSTRPVPLPLGAYPRRTSLGGWQLDWPWIVGIAFTSPLPAMPADWRLWAGNVVTGRHLVLDSYRAHRHPVAEFFPTFALSAGRVVWNLSTDEPVRANAFPTQRIALEDLATGRRTILARPAANTVYERFTFSGKRIVWESIVTAGRTVPADLWLYDLAAHQVTRLSRNTASTRSSLYPRLAGEYLLFEGGAYGSDFGTPYLVDLARKTGATGSRQWWRAYRFRQLGRVGLTNTQMGGGLVSWDFGRLLDLTRSRVWTQRYWYVDAIAGRTVLVHHQNGETGHETYAAWQMPAACAVGGD